MWRISKFSKMTFFSQFQILPRNTVKIVGTSEFIKFNRKCRSTEKCPIWSFAKKNYLHRAGGRLHIFVDANFCCVFLSTTLCNKKVRWLSSKIFRAGKSYPAQFCCGLGEPLTPNSVSELSKFSVGIYSFLKSLGSTDFFRNTEYQDEAWRTSKNPAAFLFEVGQQIFSYSTFAVTLLE